MVPYSPCQQQGIMHFLPSLEFASGCVTNGWDLKRSIFKYMLRALQPLLCKRSRGPGSLTEPVIEP